MHSLKQTAIGQIGFAKIRADRIANMQRNENGCSLLLINDFANPDGCATRTEEINKMPILLDYPI